jgi:hypothetical protein
MALINGGYRATSNWGEDSEKKSMVYLMMIVVPTSLDNIW